jgi:hypothetical protein
MPTACCPFGSVCDESTSTPGVSNAADDLGTTTLSPTVGPGSFTSTASTGRPAPPSLSPAPTSDTGAPPPQSPAASPAQSTPADPADPNSGAGRVEVGWALWVGAAVAALV